MGSKKAVLVGCNYPGTDSELRGCVNDVTRMRECLADRFGFSEEDITLLIDTDEGYTQPTASNVIDALMEMISAAEPGDFLVFHFSGHGTRNPAKEGDDDDTGYDESIYLCDGNLINDDQIRVIVNMVPSGCRITIISDSCHSGGLIEQAEEQIGDSTADVGEEPRESPKETKAAKAKEIPFSRVLNFLKEKTGREKITRRELSFVLAEVYGEDFTVKVNEFVQRCSGGALNSAREVKRGLPENGVLVSGCQTYETSADAYIDGAYAGVLTNFILKVAEQTEGEISNWDLVTQVRSIIEEEEYTQRPGLYCSDDLVGASFIC